MGIFTRWMLGLAGALPVAAVVLFGAALTPVYGQGQTAERPDFSEPLRWNHLTLSAPIQGGCGEAGLELRINSANGRIEMFSLVMEGRPVRIPAAAYSALRYVQTEGLTVSIANGACSPNVEAETLSIIFVFGIPFNDDQKLEDEEVEFMLVEFVIEGRARISRHLSTVYRGGLTIEEVVEF